MSLTERRPCDGGEEKRPFHTREWLATPVGLALGIGLRPHVSIPRNTRLRGALRSRAADTARQRAVGLHYTTRGFATSRRCPVLTQLVLIDAFCVCGETEHEEPPGTPGVCKAKREKSQSERQGRLRYTSPCTPTPNATASREALTYAEAARSRAMPSHEGPREDALALHRPLPAPMHRVPAPTCVIRGVTNLGLSFH